MAGMSFEDLPKGRARELRLTDHTHAADVIDLITFEADRDDGCISAMLCDDQDRGVKPFCIKGIPPGTPVTTVTDVLEFLLSILAGTEGSLLLARGRPGPLRPNDEDRVWHQRTIEMCRAHGARLLGFHIATVQGVVRLPDPLVAVA